MHDKNSHITTQNSVRNYGIDALRILSMLMVVALHILSDGGILETAKSVNYWIVWYLETACFCAVNCFALISGYVGVYSKWKISNLAYLWCTVVFYTIIITAVYKGLFWDSVAKRDILAAFMPIISKRYWYFTSYALLFLFIPILNTALERVPKKQMGAILIAIITATSVIQPIFDIVWKNTFALKYGYSALWLIIVYLIGGYVRKYGLFHKIKTHRTGIFLTLYFAVVSLTWLSKFAIQHLPTNILIGLKSDNFLITYTSVAIVAAALFLLLAFENMKIGSVAGKIIAFLSPLAFSVYLIHTNPFILDNCITDRFKRLSALPAYKMLLLVICIVLAVFLLCLAIDLIRHYLFKLIKLKERLYKAEIKFKEKLAAKTQ